MKVALCFSGQPRNVRKCYRLISENLITDDVDVFAHFWWDKSYKDQVMRFEFDERYKEDEGQAFIELYDPKAYSFEEQEQFDLSGFSFSNPGVCNDSLDAKVTAFNCTSMWHSVNRAFDLAKQHGEYDLYVRCRTDLIFMESIDWSTFDPRTLYVGDGRIAGEDRLLGDWFAAGGKYEMSLYCELKNKFAIINANSIYHMHDFMLKGLSDIVVENQVQLPIDYKKVRCELSMMIPNLDTCLDNKGHLDPQIFYSKWFSKELDDDIKSIQSHEFKGREKKDLPHYAKEWDELK